MAFAAAVAAATASATVPPFAEKLFASGEGLLTAEIPIAYALPYDIAEGASEGDVAVVELSAEAVMTGEREAGVGGESRRADDDDDEASVGLLLAGPVERERCMRYWFGGESGDE